MGSGGATDCVKTHLSSKREVNGKKLKQMETWTPPEVIDTKGW